MTDETLAMMEQYGGSFVRQLALLYRIADHANRQRLEGAFASKFAEYRELAERKAKRFTLAEETRVDTFAGGHE